MAGMDEMVYCLRPIGEEPKKVEGTLGKRKAAAINVVGGSAGSVVSSAGSSLEDEAEESRGGATAMTGVEALLFMSGSAGGTGGRVVSF